MKRLFVVILGALNLISCTFALEGTEVYTESFVMAYFDYTNIEVSVGDFIVVKPHRSELYCYNDEDSQQKDRYDQLAAYYGDVNFNRTVTLAIFNAIGNIMPAEDMSGIELVCLEDINEQYTKGTSVADLFTFIGLSPMKYIESGYTYEATSRDLYRSGYFPNCYELIMKSLDEVEPKDLILLGNGEGGDSHILFDLRPKDKDNCPAWGKKLRLTLNYENQYPITKDFVFAKGEY